MNQCLHNRLIFILIATWFSSTASFAQFRMTVGLNNSSLVKTEQKLKYSILVGVEGGFKVINQLSINASIDYTRKKGIINNIIIDNRDFEENYFLGNINYSIPLIEFLLSLKWQIPLKHDLHLNLITGVGHSVSMDGIDNSEINQKREYYGNIDGEKVYYFNHDPPWFTKNSGDLYFIGIGIGIRKYDLIIRYKKYQRKEYWFANIPFDDQLYSYEFYISIRL